MIENSLMAIQTEFRKLGNPEIAEHSQRFFKAGKGEYGEGQKFLGIRVPITRKFAKANRELSLKNILKLLSSPFHEERLLSLLLMIQLFQKSNSKERNKIYHLYCQNIPLINNWDLVDCSALHIVGAYLFDKDRTPLYKMVQSNNLWERRIAMISTFYFIKENDFQDTLELACFLLQDKEDLIHKAVGWMLREIGKRHLDTEVTFLNVHYSKMPRTMLRYAIEKFPEEMRQNYLKGNI